MPHANHKVFDGKNGTFSIWLTKLIICAKIYRSKASQSYFLYLNN